jgi:hypothetical protein
MLFYWVPMLLGTALSIVATLLVAAREVARACGVEVKR